MQTSQEGNAQAPTPPVDARVGMVGLGIMGSRFADRVLDAGLPLAVFDLDANAMKTVEARGATVCDSPRSVGAVSDTVVCSLPTPDAFVEVALGEDGLVRGMLSGGVVIDMGTDGPEPVRRVGAALADRGVHLVDAPVGGGPRAAESGEVVVLMGGDEAVCHSVDWLLSLFGRRRLYCGPLGSGQLVKLANNLASNSYVALLTECFALAAKGGARLEVLADLMPRTDADSGALRNTIIAKALKGDFDPVFKVALACKDLGLAVAAAEELGVSARCGKGALAWFEEAVATGYGERDQGAVMLLQLPELGDER